MIWRKEQNIPVLKRLERTSKNTARLEQAETQQNRIAHTAPDCAGYVVHGGDILDQHRIDTNHHHD